MAFLWKKLKIIFMKSNYERMIELDIKEFVLDLYEIELNKKCMYSDDIVSNKAKEGRELEFALAVKNIAILEELLNKF